MTSRGGAHGVLRAPGCNTASCAALTPGRTNASAETPARGSCHALTPGNDDEADPPATVDELPGHRGCAFACGEPAWAESGRAIGRSCRGAGAPGCGVASLVDSGRLTVEDSGRLTVEPAAVVDWSV